MEEPVVQQIKKRISRAKYGDLFFVSMFHRYDEEYVTKLLAHFEKEGLLTRISKGVYVKVRKTRFGKVYPSAVELASKIAKRDKAKIIPTGDTAANRLGFSTQVPVNTTFITSGSTRKLTLGNRRIALKHGAPRNFAYKGELVPELVQALRSIGENNVTKETEKRVAQLLRKKPETKTIEHDLSLAPAWIRKVIKNSITQTFNEKVD